VTSDINAKDIENLKTNLSEYKSEVNDRLKSIEHWQKIEIVMILLTLIGVVINNVPA